MKLCTYTSLMGLTWAWEAAPIAGFSNSEIALCMDDSAVLSNQEREGLCHNYE